MVVLSILLLLDLFLESLILSVPDALRTKYEPDVEKEEAKFSKKAMNLTPEEAQVCFVANISILL